MCSGPADGIGRDLCSPRLMLVDRDDEMRAHLTGVLDGAGFDVVGVSNDSEALTCLRLESFAAVVLDKRASGSTGLDPLRDRRTIRAETPVIMITASGDVAFYLEAPGEGSFESKIKPFQLEELLRALYESLHVVA